MSTPRPTYTPRQREEAARLASEIGVTQASEQLGIAYGTVNNWAYLARKQAKQGTQPVPPPPPAPPSQPVPPPPRGNVAQW